MAGLRDVTFDEDLFAAVMDSLQVIRQLRSSLRHHDGGEIAKLISSRTIYANLTVLELAASIHILTEHGDAAAETLKFERISKMEELPETYSQGLPQLKTNTTPRQQQDLPIVLTESTDSLGSYLPDCLLINTQLKMVICINRGADGETQQRNSKKSRGLTTEWGERVHFLSIELSKTELELDTDKHNMLVEGASAIIRMPPSLYHYLTWTADSSQHTVNGR